MKGYSLCKIFIKKHDYKCFRRNYCFAKLDPAMIQKLQKPNKPPTVVEVTSPPADIPKTPITPPDEIPPPKNTIQIKSSTLTMQLAEYIFKDFECSLIQLSE
jgi:hypothetical protein